MSLVNMEIAELKYIAVFLRIRRPIKGDSEGAIRLGIVLMREKAASPAAPDPLLKAKTISAAKPTEPVKLET